MTGLLCFIEDVGHNTGATEFHDTASRLIAMYCSTSTLRRNKR
nr:MAG TPA: hypothetical protein [Caudoviricetes sp.]